MPIFMRPAVSVLSSFSKISSGSIDTRDVVVPGQLISFAGDNLITGHGTFRNVDKINTPKTFTDQEGSLELSIPECQNLQMRASLAGRVKAVNKLVYVEPLKARYSGNIGETIVGRIIEVEQRRWRVDVNSFQVANLSLANVKLPGGEMRRKSEDDERAMRSYIKEGDLIVGEVHEIYKDGSLQLHMPGQRSGRLGGGCLLKLPPNCIKRQKLHRHRLLVPRASALLRESFPASSLSSGGLDLVSATRVGLILGCNGLVWVGLASGADWSGDAPHQTDSNSQPEIETDSLDPMERRRLAVDERLAVARVRNCILALARHRVPIWEMSVLAAFEASWLEDRHQIISGPEAIATDTEAATIDLFAGIAGLLQADASRRLAALVAAKIEASF